MRRLIVSADDFGLSEEVNEAIEIAHRDGLLSTASLMVAGPASMDAVRRARRLPNLRVGLHLVVIEGDTALPGATINAIATPDDRFGTSQLGLGISYFSVQPRDVLCHARSKPSFGPLSPRACISTMPMHTNICIFTPQSGG